MFWIGLIFGLMIGCVVGVVTMCLVSINRPEYSNDLCNEDNCTEECEGWDICEDKW